MRTSLILNIIVTIVGRKGGVHSRLSNAAQSTPIKYGCLFTSSASSLEDPNLRAGFFVMQD